MSKNNIFKIDILLDKKVYNHNDTIAFKIKYYNISGKTQKVYINKIYQGINLEIVDSKYNPLNNIFTVMYNGNNYQTDYDIINNVDTLIYIIHGKMEKCNKNICIVLKDMKFILNEDTHFKVRYRYCRSGQEGLFDNNNYSDYVTFLINSN